MTYIQSIIILNVQVCHNFRQLAAITISSAFALISFYNLFGKPFTSLNCQTFHPIFRNLMKSCSPVDVIWSNSNVHGEHGNRKGSLNPLQWRHNECHDLFRRRSKKMPMLHITCLCEGKPPFTDGSPPPPQRASNAENASIWWRHHALQYGFEINKR